MLNNSYNLYFDTNPMNIPWYNEDLCSFFSKKTGQCMYPGNISKWLIFYDKYMLTNNSQRNDVFFKEFKFDLKDIPANLIDWKISKSMSHSTITNETDSSGNYIWAELVNFKKVIKQDWWKLRDALFNEYSINFCEHSDFESMMNGKMYDEQIFANTFFEVIKLKNDPKEWARKQMFFQSRDESAADSFLEYFVFKLKADFCWNDKNQKHSVTTKELISLLDHLVQKNNKRLVA